MNKEERKQIGLKKWFKRIKTYGYWNKGNFNRKAVLCLKEQAVPCSCAMCSPFKYSRKDKHKKNILHEHTEFHAELIKDLNDE